MSEALDMIDCPQCGYQAWRLYHVTEEFEDECPYCGYTRIKSLDSDYAFKGYGHIHFRYLNGKEKHVNLKSPLSQERVNQVLEKLKQCDWRSSFYTFDDKNKLLRQYGNVPMSLEDIYESQYEISIMNY